LDLTFFSVYKHTALTYTLRTLLVLEANQEIIYLMI